MQHAPTCAPPSETPAETRHWLADRQGDLWVLRWCAGGWSDGMGRVMGDNATLYRLGWRYLGPCLDTVLGIASVARYGLASRYSWQELRGLAYRDNRMAERSCDYCALLYRGPAVYCSPQCAIRDA